jgi:protein TonB
MRQAAHPFRVSGPAAASLLVNGALIAALLHLGMGQVGRRPAAPSLTVLSLAQIKGTEQGDKAAKAAKPQKVALAHATQAPPIVTLASPIALPQPILIPATQPAANPSPMSNSVSEKPSPAPASLPTRRGSADGLDAPSPPGTSRSYAAKVRSWLYAHKIYPRRARMRREEGQVQVRFVLDRAGLLMEGAIIDGSGIATLDEEAAAMMRRASPYPRVPAEVPGERIEFTVPIDFILPA